MWFCLKGALHTVNGSIQISVWLTAYDISVLVFFISSKFTAYDISVLVFFMRSKFPSISFSVRNQSLSSPFFFFFFNFYYLHCTKYFALILLLLSIRLSLFLCVHISAFGQDWSQARLHQANLPVITALVPLIIYHGSDSCLKLTGDVCHMNNRFL